MHSKEDGCADRQKYGTGNVDITTKPTKVTKIPAESEYKFSDDSFFMHYTAVPDRRGSGGLFLLHMHEQAGRAHESAMD